MYGNESHVYEFLIFGNDLNDTSSLKLYSSWTGCYTSMILYYTLHTLYISICVDDIYLENNSTQVTVDDSTRWDQLILAAGHLVQLCIAVLCRLSPYSINVS